MHVCECARIPSLRAFDRSSPDGEGEAGDDGIRGGLNGLPNKERLFSDADGVVVVDGDVMDVGGDIGEGLTGPTPRAFSSSSLFFLFVEEINAKKKSAI